MSNSRGLAISALGVLMTLLLVACVPRIPRSSDIVGLWVERQGRQCGDGVPCASFRFYATGRFEATNMPERYFILEGHGRIDANGIWRLEPSSNALSQHRLVLDFGPNPESAVRGGYTSGLHIDSCWSGFELSNWAGDEANRIVLRRTQ
jgi:hypothetical protein